SVGQSRIYLNKEALSRHKLTGWNNVARSRISCRNTACEVVLGVIVCGVLVSSALWSYGSVVRPQVHRSFDKVLIIGMRNEQIYVNARWIRIPDQVKCGIPFF